MSALRPFAVAILSFACLAAQATTPGRLLDGFDTVGPWQALHTDDVEASLKEKDGALCLDFDFHGVSGSASLRRNLPIAFPDNYALSFDVRGDMKPNTLQLKLIDASGDNVWWHQRAAFVPTDAWQHIEAPKGDIDFAWGPTKDRSLKRSAAIELLVYVEQGGKGELCFDNLRLAPLPAEPPRAASAPPATPNALFEAKAKQVRRGLYPRGFSGEQSYWTIVGADGGSRDSALVSEDGAVEVTKGGFSIEPFVLDGKSLITWADVKTAQSLLDGYLPIPSVNWDAGDIGLTTQVFADGKAGASHLVMRYTLHNRGKTPRELTLALMARPFQVNPPTQFLNTPGGTSRIDDLAWRGRTLSVNGTPRLTSVQPVDDFVAATSLAEQLEAGKRPSTNAMHDADGFAQGALLYRFTLPAGGDREVDLVVPSPGAHGAEGDLADALEHTAAQWREKLNRVQLSVPAVGQPIVDTLRSAIAQILVSRDGPALQPGTRSYARTWVRDGAMMLEGLLRTGHEDIAGDFVRWYAPHQFSNGKVPCCVDARGSDPVPENDSHGELVFSIAELYRYTHDRDMLDDMWPHVARAVAFMDQLRRSERTPANQSADRQALYGLMPASISHEGYSAKPMHSYWDDFWAMKGYDDAVELAAARGDSDAVREIGASRDEFRHDLHASIEAAVAQHRIDFIPGAAELGDFDATSTTIAVSPGGEQGRLPPKLLENTFERYWQGFVERRDGKKAWDDYTPYELRTIGTFVRLGWRDRARELIAFFFADRRPAAWNQWAEVVGRDPRKPRFVGDMPHAWIASDYVRSALDMFAYERDGDHAMVLAAGIPVTWLDGKGVALEGLRTPYGQFGYSLRRDANNVTLSIPKGPAIPPGGFVLPWFDAKHPPGKTVVNGKPASWMDGELTIRELPANVTIAL
ncbi:MAG TPA: discoidin domain-containing protein [Luteibacter sp.]|nr:discoidin domain-containing protein [Luteibacter sp.]